MYKPKMMFCLVVRLFRSSSSSLEESESDNPRKLFFCFFLGYFAEKFECKAGWWKKM